MAILITSDDVQIPRDINNFFQDVIEQFCNTLYNTRYCLLPLKSYLMLGIVFVIAFCIVCPSSIYGFWLPLWYLRFTASGYLFGILDLRLLVTSLLILDLRLLATSLVS